MTEVSLSPREEFAHRAALTEARRSWNEEESVRAFAKRYAQAFVRWLGQKDVTVIPKRRISLH